MKIFIIPNVFRRTTAFCFLRCEEKCFCEAYKVILDKKALSRFLHFIDSINLYFSYFCLLECSLQQDVIPQALPPLCNFFFLMLKNPKLKHLTKTFSFYYSSLIPTRLLKLFITFKGQFF